MTHDFSRPLRRRCNIQASLLNPEGQWVDVHVLDLSLTGCFVETEADLHSGDTVRLSLPLPGGEPWTADVTVTRPGAGQRELRHPKVDQITVSRTGFGLSFDHVPADEVGRLKGFLELLDER